MDNEALDDSHLLWLAGIFFVFIFAPKFFNWLSIWIQTGHHKFISVVITSFVCVVLLAVVFRKLKALREKHIRNKAILGPTHDAVYCGRTAKESVYIKPKQRIMHTQIIGTTNAGKTESVILPWAIQDINQGRGLLLIDGKADRSLLEKLWAYTVMAGRKRDFRLFSLGSLEHSQTFNPLVGGSAEEITERLFNAFTFENQFYRSLQYEVLGQILRVFEIASEVPTFLKLHQAILRPALLESLCARGNDHALMSWIMNFKNLSGTERDLRTSGLTSQISHFAFGRSAPLFNSSEPAINIDEALKNNQIVYFQLPVLLSPFLGAATGKLVLQALQSAIANRHRSLDRNPKFFSVFLDDFSEYLYPGFVSVLNKSRSANVGIVFAHQALGDIESLGDSVANAILTNSNLKVLMRGNDPNTAEHFAKTIGTQSTVKVTERRKMTFMRNQKTGDVSAREVEEFVVHPNYFKRDLGVGQAVMIVPHDDGAKTIRIKFDRFPDLLAIPMPVIAASEVVGLTESLKTGGHQEQSLSEVLDIKQKESTCIH